MSRRLAKLLSVLLLSVSMVSWGDVSPVYQWDFSRIKKPVAPSVNKLPDAKGKLMYSGYLRPLDTGGHGVFCSPQNKWRSQIPALDITWPEMTLEIRFRPDVEFSASKTRTSLVYYMGHSWKRRYLDVFVTPDSRLGVELCARSDDTKRILHSMSLVGQPAKLVPGTWYTVRLAIARGGKCQLWLNGVLYEESKAVADMTALRGTYPDAYPLLMLGVAFPRDCNEQQLTGYIDKFQVWRGIVDPTGTAPVIKARKAASQANPNLVLTTCAATPSLDGKLNDDCWQKAEWSSPFKVYDVPGELLGSMVSADEKFVKTAATMALAADGKHLYLAVKCPIPEGLTCRVRCQKNGGSLWNDDCVEFFLKPFLDKPHFFQYGMNADGFLTAIKHSSAGVEDKSFKTQATCRAQRDATAFTLELAVPLRELGVADIFKAMGITFNVTRTGPTVGGGSTWAPVGTTYATPDRFGQLLPLGRKAYFLHHLTRLSEDMEKMSVAEDLKAQVRPRIVSLRKTFEKEGDDPMKWSANNVQLMNLRNSLTRLAMAGRPFLLWEGNPWANNQPNMAVPMRAKPLERIQLRTVRNSRVLFGFLFSNLGDDPMMPRIKIIPDKPGQRFFMNSLPKKGTEAYELARRTTFLEGLPMKDKSGKVVPDPLLPLALNSVIRCAGGSTVPLWMIIKTDGMKPGVYRAKIILRPTYQAMPPQECKLELTVEDVDLDEVRFDSFTYSDVKNPAFYQLAKDYNLNIVYMGTPGQGLMRKIYPKLDASGKVLVKPDFSGMDWQIDQSLAKGFKPEDLKIFFFLGFDSRYYRDLPHDGQRQKLEFGSEPWKRGFKSWLDAMGAHLQQKYGMSLKQVIMNPEDESTGDPEDPKSAMGIAMNSVKYLKELAPEIRTMLNPYLEKSEKVDYHKLLTYLKRHTDIIELYAPRLEKAPELADIIRKHGNFEIWVYGIVDNSSAPGFYRHLYWVSWNCGVSAVCGYWHFDSHSGGDGMNPFDWSYSPKNTSDYGVVYTDEGSDQVLVSRRSEAWYQGFVDYRLAAICTRRLDEARKKGRQVAVWEKALVDIVKRGMTADIRGLDRLQQELIDLILKIK